MVVLLLLVSKIALLISLLFLSLLIDLDLALLVLASDDDDDLNNIERPLSQSVTEGKEEVEAEVGNSNDLLIPPSIPSSVSLILLVIFDVILLLVKVVIVVVGLVLSSKTIIDFVLYCIV